MPHPSPTEIEIEIAYLPTSVPKELLVRSPTRIIDSYLSPADDLLTKLRLRQKGDKYELTKKVNTDPQDLSLQDEYTIPLSRQEFETLRALNGREVVKDRYEAPFGEHTLEIDVFKGDLEGLVIIEVEFKNQADRDAFAVPDYFGVDVTQEDFVAGVYLAGKRYADIEHDIARVRA